MSHGHYFDPDPEVRSRPGRVELVLPDFRAELTVDSGVFAASGVDPGTLELLRATSPSAPEGDLLDLGCGYGPIACTLAHRATRAQVWAIDVNQRALRLTALNAEHLGLTNIHPVGPDALPGEIRFNGIWSNPPIRIGKPALHDLLRRWLPRLAPGGDAWLVVQRHLGADSLAAWLGRDEGGSWGVDRVRSKRGYRILRVHR